MVFDFLRSAFIGAEEGLEEITPVICSRTFCENWKSPWYKKFDDAEYRFFFRKDTDSQDTRLVLKYRCEVKKPRRLRCKYRLVVFKEDSASETVRGHRDFVEGSSQEEIYKFNFDQKIQYFLIFSGLTKIMERIVEEKVTNEASGMRLRFENLFLDKMYSDVVLRPKSGEDVPAHRVVLAAASPLFDFAFRCDSAHRKKSDRIVVPFDASREAVVETLRYIYAGKVGDFDQLSLYDEVLRIAKKYELAELRNECERILVAGITTENAMQILQLADVYGMRDLKTEAVGFITSQMNGPKSVDEKSDILLNQFVSKCSFLK